VPLSAPRMSKNQPAHEGATERRVVDVDDTSLLLALTGPQSELLKIIARETGAEVGQRGNSILLSGYAAQVDLAERFLAETSSLLRSGAEFSAGDYVRALANLKSEPTLRLRELFDDAVIVPSRGRTIAPKSLAQRSYVQAIRTHDLTFGIGPAGTGKTYLAMAMAVGALLERRVKRIVLARPAVEAGEKLGFLPGDLAEKVNPYLRPLYDALNDIMDFDKAQALLSRGQIEVAPLAFMRGRTLSDAFVILDEAQNATSEQMRMFLTRLGLGSRAVVTGDITQVDLPSGATSGLSEARALLSGVPGIAFCQFSDVDVVRHPLVQRIVLAYEARDRARQQSRDLARGARRERAGEQVGEQISEQASEQVSKQASGGGSDDDERGA
jgi:phosphate starvation-inducible protein PhoH and related proteins